MDLFLFANFFPYKKAEPFLTNEINFAKKNSETVSIFTLYGSASETSADVSGLILFDPVFELTGDKKAIFYKGIFNLAPFNFHFKELFAKGIIFSPKKFYWLLTSLLVTRAALSSKGFKDLIKQINSAKKPVLYFYWGDNLAWLIPYLKKRIPAKTKMVMRLHGSDLYENLKADYAPLRELIFSAVDNIYPVSENGADYLMKKYPAYVNKISVARLGVSDNGPGPVPSGDFTIVSVSNLVPLKRVHLIFEALEMLDSKITWHHFGDGPLFNELNERIKTHRNKFDIHFHGFVSNKEIINFYKATPADLFLNVSTTEGVPVSIMEALSFGIPVIATNVGGTAELVNDGAGKLLDAEINAAQLSAEVAHFLQLPKEEKNRMRKNARLQFEEKALADKNYTGFYKQLAG